MQRPRAISAWSVSLKLLKLIGQGCPRNFADMGGYDLAVGIDEDRGRKDAVAGHVHEAHLRVKHHRAGRYPAREQVIGNGLPVLALVGEEYGNIGICRDVSKHGKLPPARRTPGRPQVYNERPSRQVFRRQRSEEHTSELQSLMRIS